MSGIVDDHSGNRTLRALCSRHFPDGGEAPNDPGLYWVEPRERGVIPLDGFRIGKRLARTVRSDVFQIRFDHDFDGVINGLRRTRTGPGQDLESTSVIRELYGELFDLGLLPLRSRSIMAAIWSADSTGSISAGPFSARACSTANARTPRRWRFVFLVARLVQGGYRLLVHAIRHSAPGAVRRCRSTPTRLQASARARADRRNGGLACVADHRGLSGGRSTRNHCGA